MPTPFHDPAILMAARANERSNEIYREAPNDILRDALFILNHDAICVHRSIAALAWSGWPSSAACLLRTLLDMNVSAIALVMSPNPRLAAFRFLYSSFRRLNRLADFPAEVRAHNRAQIRQRLDMLPPALKSQALEVIRDKDRRYWFNPEWDTPVAVLEAFAAPPMKELYLTLSAVAHGGFLGMRLFREQPDAKSIQPEQPARRAVALDLYSCRFLLEIVRLRDSAENLGLASEITELIDDIRAAGLRQRQLAT